jgi:hypothetical protein
MKRSSARILCQRRFCPGVSGILVIVYFLSLLSFLFTLLGFDMLGVVLVVENGSMVVQTVQ